MNVSFEKSHVDLRSSSYITLTFCFSGNWSISGMLGFLSGDSIRSCEGVSVSECVKARFRILGVGFRDRWRDVLERHGTFKTSARDRRAWGTANV